MDALTLWWMSSLIFSSVLERQLKIGSYRLPTHRRVALGYFLIIPSYFAIEILAMHTL